MSRESSRGFTGRVGAQSTSARFALADWSQWRTSRNRVRRQFFFTAFRATLLTSRAPEWQISSITIGGAGKLALAMLSYLHRQASLGTAPQHPPPPSERRQTRSPSPPRGRALRPRFGPPGCGTPSGIGREVEHTGRARSSVEEGRDSQFRPAEMAVDGGGKSGLRRTMTMPALILKTCESEESAR